MNVRDLMTPRPQTIAPTETLASARVRMDRGGFRRLPVVDAAGRLLGIVTDRDLRGHRGRLTDTLIAGAMVDAVTSVDPDDAVEDVAHLMLRDRVGGFPVVDRRHVVVGVISESDVLRGLVRHPCAQASLDVPRTRARLAARAWIPRLRSPGWRAVTHAVLRVAVSAIGLRMHPRGASR
jgi:CBS domain-containing protein